MQLPLGSDPRTETLRRIHTALIERFGRIERPPEKRRDPEWTLVQGVIGARTRTALSNAATDRLLADYGSWEKVARAPLDDLVEKLAGQTFPEQSAARLKACLLAILEQRGTVDLRHLSNLGTEQAMAWLETLPGIGRKISAQVVNASTFNRRTMVIDTHHRRIMQRVGLVPPKADTERSYAALMAVVPPEWSSADLDEHHLLLKRLGQVYCRPSQMDCDACPVARLCRTGYRTGQDRAGTRVQREFTN